MQENFGLLFGGMSLSLLPFLSHHPLKKQKRIFCTSVSTTWIELLHFPFRRKKKSVRATPLCFQKEKISSNISFLKGRKENKKKPTKKNKTKRMSFHTFDVRCLKWGIFWLGMRSYPGHISPSLKSPEVTTVKSSFSFLMLTLLQSAYALSSWKK